MRIAFCWFNISGYMAACWRALAARPGVEVMVFAFAPDAAGNAPFDPAVLAGVPHQLLGPADRADPDKIASHLAAFRPDFVFISGWAHPPYVRLLRDPRLARARFGMTMDTPWRGTLRQKLGRFKLAPIARRLHRVVVAGERAFILAEQLGIDESKIRRGVYGYDDDHFAKAFEARGRADSYPRKFLFTGMYERHKGLDLILDAYARYRAEVADPWPLTCCGRGPMNDAVSAAEGVINRGFVQPADQPAVFADHAAFVIASRFEPWGVVIAEASASGLPVICSEACGASVELVRSYYNGITVPTGQVEPLARAFRWMHDHPDAVPEMGRRAREFAQGHSARMWAERIEIMIRE